MSTLTDPPKASFRLSQLVYDTRYRSLTIQVVAAILIFAGLAWLINNTIQNLEALGKDFDFGFLVNPAGYDINQRLVEYDSQDTHGRAALVGILNTLLVAVLGCITATFIGVFAGVLRLSSNWVVNKLMAVYVEGFRNVPLLLWILLIFAIMTESMPQPRDFRGEEPEATMSAFDAVAFTNRGIYIPRIGFTNSIGEGGVEWRAARDAAAGDATALSELPGPVSSGTDWLIVIVVFGASVFGFRTLGKRADRIQEATGERPNTLGLRLAVLFGPVIVVFIALGATMVTPYLRGFNFTEGIHLRNSLIALWFALSLYTGAFIAEIVRAGIMAVNKGQTEAAYALGMRPNWTMNLVILPQALRVIIPPLISQFLNLTKNSSLALAVGYMDIRSTLGGITINQTGRELEGMLLMGAFYLAVSLIISAVMNFYNQSTQLKER